MIINLWNLWYVVVVIFLLLYVYLKWEQGYFPRRGVKSLPFNVPFLAHTFKVFMNQEHIIDTVQRHYNAFPGEKYVGVRQFNMGLIQIRDLDLLKQTLVKDFDHFQDHQVLLPSNNEVDALFTSSLFGLKGEKWRDMRATLSPAFTSTKMKSMFQFIVETSEQMTDYFKQKMEKSENKERGLVEAEMRDTFTRYANDVIASAAFGIKVNSLEEKNNQFYKMGILASNFGGWVQIKLFFAMIIPWLLKIPNFTIFDATVSNFFRTIVLDAMKRREEQGIVRPDMIHLLMQARKGSLKYETTSKENTETGFATVEESDVGKRLIKRNWSDTDIVAQAFLFFVAGFDSTATLLCFLSHELATNPDIQKKLQDEIDGLLAKKGSRKLEYTDLVDMKYMDMVVSETLRKWPGAITTDRSCVKAYKLPPTSGNSKGYMIQPGEGLEIPIYAIHHDPKYFPNPEKFDPERFSEENKHKIVPLSYIPFGVGPRNCIGNRFALMETKAVVFHLLANFDFVQTAKTSNPIRLKKVMFNLISEDGFWIGLKPRDF